MRDQVLLAVQTSWRIQCSHCSMFLGEESVRSKQMPATELRLKTHKTSTSFSQTSMHLQKTGKCFGATLVSLTATHQNLQTTAAAIDLMASSVFFPNCYVISKIIACFTPTDAIKLTFHLNSSPSLPSGSNVKLLGGREGAM